MEHHVAVVHDDPAIARLALFPPFLAELAADSFQGAICERIEHAVAGAGADHKVVRKGGHLFDIEQEDVLAFFVFEQIDDRMGKFKRIQESPL